MGTTTFVVFGVVAVLAVAAVLWSRHRGRTRPDRAARAARRSSRPHDQGVLEAKGMAEAHRNHQQSGGFGF